jgi:hypothetical protein
MYSRLQRESHSGGSSLANETGLLVRGCYAIAIILIMPIRHHVYNLFFRCDIVGGNSTENHETIEIKFFQLIKFQSYR